MGRRSSKSSPAAGAAVAFDTVGMTILPGRSLPEWAEPAAAAAEAAAQSGPELIADAPAAPLEQEISPAAQDTPTPSQVPEAWAAAAAPVGAPRSAMPQESMTPGPAMAMAGAAAVGGSAPGLGGYGQHPAQGYPPEPSRYPAAPAAGLAAMAASTVAPQAAPPAPPQSPAFGPTPAAPAYGQGWPASAPGAHAGSADAGPVMSTTTFPAPPAPPAAGEHTAGTVATATYATDPHPAAEPGASHHEGTGTGAPVATAPTDAPSNEWKSPERPELTPQHVALLSWWADMIAAGQFPAPPGTAGAEESAPVTRPRRSFPIKVAAVGLVAVAAIGAAAVVGPKVMASSEPAVVGATEVSVPATVGPLVAITDPAVGSELETLLGFGLRPAGMTVTSAYGTTAAGPLAMAAMATTMGAPAEAVGQIATWAARTGATVAPSVAGTGANEGITCAAVEAIPEGQPGSFCVWTGSGERGQTYVVGTSVEEAQALTSQLRSAVTGP
jgi:hypothetical protein